MCRHNLIEFACGCADIQHWYCTFEEANRTCHKQVITKQRSSENCPNHKGISADQSQQSDETSSSPRSRMEEGSTAASSPPSTYDHQVREKEERSPARPSSSQGSDSDRDEVLPFAVQRQANRFKRAVAQHVSHLHLEHGKRSREVTPEQCLEKSFHRLCLELDDDNEDGGATILDRTAPVLRGQAPLFGAGVTFLAGGNPGVARETPTPVENACVTEKVPFPSSKTLVPASKAPVPASKTPVPASKTPVPEKKAPIHTGRPSIGPPAFLGAPIGILTPAKVYPHGPSNAVLKDRTLLPNRGGDPFVAGRRRNLKTRKGKKGKKEEQDNEEDWVSEED